MASEYSINNQQGRFTQGGKSTQFENRLGWWERRIIPQADDDIFLTISARYDRRPDLVSFDFYGKALYQWMVLQYNNIVDVNTEFVVGKEIRLPSKSRAFREILTRTTQ